MRKLQATSNELINYQIVTPRCTPCAITVTCNTLSLLVLMTTDWILFHSFWSHHHQINISLLPIYLNTYRTDWNISTSIEWNVSVTHSHLSHLKVLIWNWKRKKYDTVESFNSSIMHATYFQLIRVNGKTCNKRCNFQSKLL